MTLRVSEKAVQAQGVALLRSLGAAVYVLGTVRARGDYPGTRQTPGLPDVLAFLPFKRSASGGHVAFWWEVKAARGRVRPEQAEFARLCELAAVEHVTGDLDALLRWLVAMKFLRADQLPASRQPVKETAC